MWTPFRAPDSDLTPHRLCDQELTLQARIVCVDVKYLDPAWHLSSAKPDNYEAVLLIACVIQVTFIGAVPRLAFPPTSFFFAARVLMIS